MQIQYLIVNTGSLMPSTILVIISILSLRGTEQQWTSSILSPLALCTLNLVYALTHPLYTVFVQNSLHGLSFYTLWTEELFQSKADVSPQTAQVSRKGGGKTNCSRNQKARPESWCTAGCKKVSKCSK